MALVRQERDANKKRKAEQAALRRAVAAALLPSAAEGDEAVDIATLVQALEGLTSAGAGAGSGAGAAHMVESSAAEAELLELQVPARLHDARGIDGACTHAHALAHVRAHAQRDMRLRPRSVGWRSKRWQTRSSCRP